MVGCVIAHDRVVFITAQRYFDKGCDPRRIIYGVDGFGDNAEENPIRKNQIPIWRYCQVVTVIARDTMRCPTCANANCKFAAIFSSGYAS